MNKTQFSKINLLYNWKWLQYNHN